MAIFPDDIWRQILEIGINVGPFDYTDLCSLSVTSHRFNQLTNEPALWAVLLSRDFPSFSLFDQTPSKDLYRDELEKGNYECLAKWLDEMRLDNSSFYSWETGRVPVRSFGTGFNHVDISLPPLDMNFVDSLMSDEHLISSLMSIDRSHISSHVPQSSAREIMHGFKENLRRRGDEASRFKVVPNSKSYISLNRRQCRPLPRKI